jgi:hypothetical protein
MAQGFLLIDLLAFAHYPVRKAADGLDAFASRLGVVVARRS